MAEIPKYSEKKEQAYERAGRNAEKRNPFFRFLNMNPAGVSIMTANCSVRAICTAENRTYEETAKDLLMNLARLGYGYYAYNWQDYLDHRYMSESWEAEKGKARMTGKSFAETHPTGRYVLRLANHLTACIDGQICDTWDCSSKSVYKVWLVE